MASLWSRLTRRDTREPPSFPTDDVVPVHVFDDLPGYRTTLMTWTFQFNDVLDPEKLQSALFKLIKEGQDWRKLGGRLRLTDGKLYVHIPQPFTAERPPVKFTKSKSDGPLAADPVASRLPSLNLNGTLSTHPGPDTFLELGVPGYTPKTIQDYIYSDEPILSTHVHVFEDATLLSVQHLHLVTDTMGFVALMKAWQAALAGTSEIPRFLGLDKDPMAAFYQAEKTEDYVLADKQLKGSKLAVFILRFVWKRFWQQYETRTICLTADIFSAIREEAKSKLLKSNLEDQPPFVSDGDILAAWASHAVAEFGKREAAGPMTLIIPADIRCRAKDVFPEGTASVQNAILAVFVQLSASHLRKNVLGETALEIRHAIKQQITRPQINTLANIAKETLAAGGHPPFVSDSTGSMPVIITNWAKANFFDEIDFSPAVVGPGAGGRPGRVVYYHAEDSKDSSFSSPMFTIFGKDGQGNYWLSGHLPVQRWTALEGSIARYKAKAKAERDGAV